MRKGAPGSFFTLRCHALIFAYFSRPVAEKVTRSANGLSHLFLIFTLRWNLICEWLGGTGEKGRLTVRW